MSRFRPHESTLRTSTSTCFDSHAFMPTGTLRQRGRKSSKNDAVIEIDLSRPTELSDEHWSAICDGVSRIQRAQRDTDWSAAVGAAKELCETVARIVLAARHEETSGDYPALIASAHKTLDRLPGFGSAAERPVRDMA